MGSQNHPGAVAQRLPRTRTDRSNAQGLGQPRHQQVAAAVEPGLGGLQEPARTEHGGSGSEVPVGLDERIGGALRFRDLLGGHPFGKAVDPLP